MYAIIKTGGKQYRVAEGDVITIEKLEVAANESVTFEEVLTVVNDGDVKVGAPLVNGAKVTGTVLEHGKGKKILVFKYLSLIHISEPTRLHKVSRMPSSA